MIKSLQQTHRLLVRHGWCVLLSLLLSACVSSEPFYNSTALTWEQEAPAPDNNVLYTVFLIGDVGAPDPNGEPSLQLMRKMMMETGENSATIFLGDNVYTNGLPPEGRFDREVSERRLKDQLDILKGYPGEKYMIPGNHDWNHSGRGGLEYVMREQRFVNEYLTEENIVVGGDFYVPGNGCPGPYEVRLSDDLVMIALDSEWWLHPFDRPYGDNSNCSSATEGEMLVKLEDIIEKNSGSDILIVAHHPLMTRGEHGGFFTLRDHIFPISMLRDWVYLPLPIIGSIYPFARKYGGILQDIPHPRYQAYIQGLLDIFNKYDNIVYAAGHEHSLQYFKYNNLAHIVSGSGCKTDYVKPGVAEYAHKIKGFVKTTYHQNGEVWAEFWTPEGKGETGKVTFRTLLYSKKPRQQRPRPQDDTNYTDSTIVVAANSGYQANGLHTKLLGEHYRREWATPVEVPLLDMNTARGGLTPYQKGGGKQTAVLKVRTPEATEYSLRTVDKDPTMSLPPYLRETAARTLLQDQISAQHPYGALIIPPLADAAGIYHTNPELIYIPDTPLLRQYRDEFSNTLAFLEEDADENHENTASLGYAKNLVGTDKVLDELMEDNDHEVDQRAYVRARLFDMLIGDWDRHEGQWRWVEEDKPDKGNLYTPVPEDRDQAFFKADGVLPWLVTRKWGIRNIQNFGYDFEDVIGLNLSGITLDRTLTSKVTRQEWLQISEDIRQRMTDEVIERAVQEWPEPIRELSAAEVTAKLKARREKLPEVAAEYYDFLAQYVDIMGSNKHERFLINRLNDEELQVIGYKTSKEGELRTEIFNRTFLTSETKEVRIYGLGGRDEFILSGDVNKSILVRIIGGNDEDIITDSSRVSGLRKHTVVYDTEEGNQLSFGSETRDKTSPDSEINLYDRDNYKLPYLGPRLSAEYNIEDGVFLGAGILWRTQRFRKSPYAAEHLLEANYAFRTSSYNLRYTGDVRQVVGHWHLGLNAHMQGPQFQRNFYGLGNDTRKAPDVDNSYYRVRYERQSLSALFYREPFAFIKVGIGPTYDRFRIDDPDGESFLIDQAFSGQLEEGTYNIEQGRFEVQHYMGAKAFFNLEVLGSGSTSANPRIGMRWYNSIHYNKQLGAEKLDFTNLSTEFRFYLTPNFPFKLTWSGRIGAAHNIGDFRFYQANTLGGTENLRGYRRTRYAGRSSLFMNGEGRLHLLDYNLYLTPAKLGLLAHIDAGRVYYDGDQESGFLRELHMGYGGGVWMDLLNRTVLSLTYSVGDDDDDDLWMLKFGFFF